MHVARNRSTYVAKAGEERVYESVLLRRTYRDGGKVSHETLANLSTLPAEAITAVEATLKGQTLVPAGSGSASSGRCRTGTWPRSRRWRASWAFPRCWARRCRSRDLAVALIVSRVVRPKSKLSTLAWWPDTTLGVDLGVAGASTDEVYAAMDWLAERQDTIEKKLAAKHLAPDVNPGRMALFDLTSAWVTGRCCELAARGYSRDGKKGCEQIEYGVLTDPAGRPVAVRVFPGNTADPVAFTEIVTVIRDELGIQRLVLVGDRGMITSARIDALRELNDNPDTATDFGWITALRAPAIAKLARDDGPLQMSLFDTQDLAEISPPRLPRRTVDRLPQPRARRRTRPQTPTCSPRPTNCSPASPTGSPAAPSPAPARSARRWAR